MGGSFHNQWPYLTRVSNNDTDCMQVSIVASRKHIISLIGWLWSQLYSRVVSDIGICQGLSSQSPFSLIRHLHVPSRRVWWGVDWRVTAVKIGCMIWSRQKTCHVAEKDAFPKYWGGETARLHTVWSIKHEKQVWDKRAKADGVSKRSQSPWLREADRYKCNQNIMNTRSLIKEARAGLC